MKNKKDLHIPFLKTDGSLVHHVWYEGEVKWIPNFEINGVFELTGIQQNRSSQTILCTLHGIPHSMFMSEFIEMLKLTCLNKGRLEGKFSYVKRGANFSLTYLGE